MSDTTTPSPTPAPVPQTPSPQPPKISKTAGCLTLVILWCVIFGIADMAGCDWTKTTTTQENADEKIARQLAGPNNPIVQKIKTLNMSNAYSTGYNDGVNEVSRQAQRVSMMQGDMVEQLRNLKELKGTFFDMAGQISDNHLDPGVLAEYRRGWNDGWDTLQQVR